MALKPQKPQTQKGVINPEALSSPTTLTGVINPEAQNGSKGAPKPETLHPQIPESRLGFRVIGL